MRRASCGRWRRSPGPTHNEANEANEAGEAAQGAAPPGRAAQLPATFMRLMRMEPTVLAP